MPNALISEQSPYLLQHANNPVDWRPWGDAAFEEARIQHKPLIVSIGYAACHWCHVMEHESFEDDATAAYMNEHFVCIKVDREEHPDVDAMYMDAVQAISGSGGWPLNVFVTPERMPFYGGTYFPPRPAYSRPSWMQILQRMTDIWTNQPAEIKAQTEQMTAYLKQTSAAAIGDTHTVVSEPDIRNCAVALLKMADGQWGGFGAAPKFPGAMAITFLLEHYHFYKDEKALEHALFSLDKILEGGIYDQIGGGFARYSTDREWLAPHFEKMLYDNALLVHTLCDAYAITKRARYKAVIEDTIAFVNQELRDASGGFWCALDADSEGVEGKFYTFTWQEWIAALGGHDALAASYFGVTEEGNWEGTNILHVAVETGALARKYGLPESEVSERIAAAKTSLLNARNSRVRPATDDKCLLSWNALMNIALTRAGTVLERPDYLQQAHEHARWMLDTYTQGGMLLHTWKKGIARIPAKLDDYAFFIQALLQTGSAVQCHAYIEIAAEWTVYVLENFAKENTALLYLSSAGQQDIPVRKVDVYDGATPSANAVMAHNLYLLGMVMEKSDWLARAEENMARMATTMARYTYSFSYWAMLAQRHLAGMKTVVISGINARQADTEMRKIYLPAAYNLVASTGEKDLPLLIGKASDMETLIFVCSANACAAPVATIAAALAGMGYSV